MTSYTRPVERDCVSVSFSTFVYAHTPGGTHPHKQNDPGAVEPPGSFFVPTLNGLLCLVAAGLVAFALLAFTQLLQLLFTPYSTFRRTLHEF